MHKGISPVRINIDKDKKRPMDFSVPGSGSFYSFLTNPGRNRLSSLGVKTLLLLCALFLSSCSLVVPASKRSIQPPTVDYVVASWYGAKFHGRPTSSGERYDMYGLTAAHKEFPFGTRLRVTNIGKSRSVVVTINDRGPFIAGRDLDLSYGAAREIGLVEQGVSRVRIEYLGRDMRYVKRVKYVPETAFSSTTSSSVPYTIQVGSFTEESNAARLKKGLRLKYKGVYITTTYINGQKFYRIRIGNFKNRDKAYSFAETLAEEGYSTFITKKD